MLSSLHLFGLADCRVRHLDFLLTLPVDASVPLVPLPHSCEETPKLRQVLLDGLRAWSSSRGPDLPLRRG